MAWAKRQHSKGDIDRAGALLLKKCSVEELDWAFNIVSNWRACHSYPLQIIKMTLRNRAKVVNHDALIAQRLKRLPSIILKLKHNEHMKLSQMQDIGGCRAVMPNASDMRRLKSVYDEANTKNPRLGRPIQHEVYDYIANPKPDGYRSHHLIFKYQTEYADKREFEGQRIEIQIRSRLQHAWATAVEVVQTFTGHALKSKIKTGDPDWLRFFALMGSALALRERLPLVPGTPENRNELVAEIRYLSQKLAVQHSLEAWGYAMYQVAQDTAGAAAFLLILDSEQKTLQAIPFKGDELPKASERYLQVEKEMEKRPEVQAVLVSVESVEDLQAAYPNYYLDTTAFIKAMNLAIKEK